ncbi:MAG: hypothetical protein HKO77_01380 [Gemmatimonadetes bacterium]|nr:hypothetical protein [Gemmatimonadota bacterium]
MIIRLRPRLLVALLALAACDGTVAPTAPEAADPSYVLIDGSTNGNSGFYVLPPLFMGPPSVVGTFDPTLRPRVEICEWSAGDQACVAGGASFSYTLLSGVEDEVVEVEDDHYVVHWDTRLAGVDPGKVFRASVFLVTRRLGSVDIEIARTGRAVRDINAGDNRGLVDRVVLPFRFSIVEGAVAAEEAEAEAECVSASGDVVDCDVEIVSSSEGTTVLVQEEPGTSGETLAATVTIAEDDAVDENGDPVEEFVFTLQHITTPPAPVEAIPAAQQIPFFVEAVAVDESGNPVFFQVGATLVLCQPPDLGNPAAALFIPDDLHHFLKLYQVRDGVTELLPTTLDNQANCPGGLHGGLNTTGLRRFSGFGAVLPTLPSASTAAVPDGTIGSPTTLDIQAALDATHDQIFGGDEVVVTITGANAATPAVTDNGDGTYTAQYTPTSAGTDNVSIQIRNTATGALEAISGSPFTSQVAPTTPQLSIDDVTVTEGDAGTTDAVFTVSLSSVSAQTVTVDFATEDGTATAPGDYITNSGTLTFVPGIVTQTITVEVVGDEVSESLIESFGVVLSLPVNATIADANALGAILDDDPIG